MIEDIDIVAWRAALKAMRSHPGMGAIYLSRDPYKCDWYCKIDFADGQTFGVHDGDVNDAIRKATAAVEAGYRWTED